MSEAASAAGGGVDAVELLRDLLRFDTSNPPGAERACLEFLQARLERAGISTWMLSVDPERPNLLGRIRGRGEAPPLLLYGHVDVVPAGSGGWEHPPFAAEIANGALWGRGALDMKGGVALIVAAAIRLAEGSEPPAGDVLLALTSDEEAGSHPGMRFLVEEHPQEWDGVRHALSELGGMTLWLGERKLTPVQIAEKQRCVIRATVEGRGGHAAAALSGTAAGALGQLLATLDSRSLPYRLTPVATVVLEAVAEALGGELGEGLRRIAGGADPAVELAALGEAGAVFEPLLRDTAVPTAAGGWVATNVVPTELYVDLDVRILPGGSPEGVIAQLEQLVPVSARYEVRHREPAIEGDADLSLLPLLSAAAAAHEPGAPVVPWMLSGYTDARYLSRLGIQTYGFLPLRLPPTITTGLMHAPNERVPVDSIEPGVDCLLGAVRAYRG
ncbi:MAG: M20/M25/M40 family metallo-hydrolase [Actinobacteria bacterium]|nr:M20/M25/M40 family metallo-hydrolase [Actinomycetota bacterium]